MPVNYKKPKLKTRQISTKKNSVSTYVPKDYDVNTVTFNDVKNDPQFIDDLYYSGGKNAPFMRKLANVINVGGNYVNGLIDPKGPTRFSLGEGMERQAVAAALYNQYYGEGHSNITDTAHKHFNPENGDSGKSFHGQNAENLNWEGKVKKQLNNAIELPYHNVYGQSWDTYFDNDGFHSLSDNYNYNNVWGYNSKEGRPVVTKRLEDGEGNMGLIDSLKEGYNAFKQGVHGIQPLMETVASKRGVNTKRHNEVKYIPQSKLDAWAKEWVQTRKKK